MKELELTQPLSWLDGIDPKTGRIIQEGHPQRGESIAGKVLRMPHSSGSTVGAYVFFALREYGTAPAKIILKKADSVTISAELAGIPVEIEGGREVRLEGDFPEEFKRFLEREASIVGAEEFVQVRSVHVSGVSYATIGDWGKRWLSKISEMARVREGVLATSNPAGMDVLSWRKMGVPESFARGQLEIVEHLTRMGIVPSLTCTPYLVGNLPRRGEHISWGESSAVAFANSVIGARTNREGGVKTIVAAVTGLTPKYGMHLEESRKPDLKVVVEPGDWSYMDYTLLGYLTGEESPSSVPCYSVSGDIDQVKGLGAGGAASGSIEMFHLGSCPVERRLEVFKRDLEDLRERLSSFDGGTDLVAIGCPHLSLRQLREIASLMMGRRAKVPFWLYTSRASLAQLPEYLNKSLEKAGVKVWADTCMVVSPLERMGVRKVTTNSAKAAKYLRSLRGLDVELLKIREILERYTSPA